MFPYPLGERWAETCGCLGELEKVGGTPIAVHRYRGLL